MFKLAGVTIDWYDDKGETLRSKFPTLDDVPDVIKTAGYRPPENLANEDFALVAIDHGHVFRKFACYDPGSTAMSAIYFMEHGDKLPEEVQKIAAVNLAEACKRFGMKPPEVMEKVARVFGATAPSSSVEAAIPYEHRRRHYENYLQQKAVEQPTGLGTALATGGLVGGGLGLLSGGVPGALVGGGLGAGAGALARWFDKGKIDDAQNALAAGDNGIDDALAQHVHGTNSNQRTFDDMEAERRHQELLNKLGSAVDITGAQPGVKMAAASNNANDYAVTMPDGTKMFPIDSWDNIKQAEAYWLEMRQRFLPEMRRQYATKLAAKAEQVGYVLDEQIKEAGAKTYASGERIREALDMRKVAFPRSSPERKQLDVLFEKRASISPEEFATTLCKFDQHTGLHQGWDRAVLDPWASTFGKEADTVVWEKGLDRVTASQLHNLALNYSGGLREKFTTGFVDEFEKDPIAMFNSMPDPQKRLLARLADNMAHSGGSESGHITDGKRA